MGNGDYDYFLGCLPDNNIVGKAPQDESLYSLSSCLVRQFCNGNNVCFQQIKSGFDGSSKFSTQPGVFLLVPGSGLDGFLGRLRQDADPAH